MKKIILSLATAALLFSCKKNSSDPDPVPPTPPPAPPPVTQNDITSIDNAVSTFMTSYSIPGVSIAITRSGKLVYAKAYGKMSSTDATAITKANAFRIASVSKPITAVGIMKLLEAGKLTMSSKVFGTGSILGADFPSAPAGTHDITVQHLLQHTVGVWGNDGNDPMFQQPTYSQSQLINWTLANYPATSGRGTYRYSNFGYCLLGRIIEKLSGKTYEQFIKDEVLTPCGIATMQIGGSTVAERKSGEVLYTGQNNYNPYAYNIPRLDAHGGWISSATDLARFLVRIDGFTTKADILQSSTITTMITPPASSSYACGWLVNASNNWWHSGGLPGTATEIVRSSGGFNMVVLCNSRSYQTGFDTALDNLLWPAVSNTATPWQDIDQF